MAVSSVFFRFAYKALPACRAPSHAARRQVFARQTSWPCPAGPNPASPSPASSVQQGERVGGVVHVVDAGPYGATAKPNRAPAPGGEPELSSVCVATCFPPGVVSTRFPSAAFTVSTSPLGATVRPSGVLSAPPEVTVWPVPALLRRNVANRIAAILLATLSATNNVPWESRPTPVGPTTSAAGSVSRGSQNQSWSRRRASAGDYRPARERDAAPCHGL